MAASNEPLAPSSIANPVCKRAGLPSAKQLYEVNPISRTDCKCGRVEVVVVIVERCCRSRLVNAHPDVRTGFCVQHERKILRGHRRRTTSPHAGSADGRLGGRSCKIGLCGIVCGGRGSV